MSCKSAIYVCNTSNQTVAANETLNVGNIVRRFGNNLSIVGNSVGVSGIGYYSVCANVTLQPTATGTVSVSLAKDGVAVIGAESSCTIETVGDSVTLPICAIVREKCCKSDSILTFVLGDLGATITNVAVKVEKL